MINNGITISYGDLYTVLARSLSIIGKRANDEQGRNIFGTITLGTAERDLANDFFSSAFTEICAAIRHFVTTEINNTTPTGTTQNVDFWVPDGTSESSLVPLVTSSGQLEYNYGTHALRQTTVSYRWDTYPVSSTDVFVYDSVYYDYLMNVIEEPTEAQIEAAITLDYMGSRPTVNSEGLIAYDNGFYVSSKSVTFSDATPSDTTVYINPYGSYYRWEYGSMQYEPSGIATNVELVVTVPDNWNTALVYSLRQALYNYCIAYALFSWFTVTAPHISQKYLLDTQRQMAAIIGMIHEKTDPQEGTVSFKRGTSVTQITTT